MADDLQIYYTDTREIRMVPVDWQHPLWSRGQAPHAEPNIYRPCYDLTVATAIDAWQAERVTWEQGSSVAFENHKRPPIWYEYRPPFIGDPICFQVYATIDLKGLGIPISTIFKSFIEMIQFLLNEAPG